MFLFIFSALKRLQNNILSVAWASNDNHTKISHSHWSFQETLGRGVQTKKPFGGEGGVWIFFTFLEPHSILKNICMLFQGHIQLGTLRSENGDV